MLEKSSRNRLNRYTAKLIKGDSLFARIGRAVCEAECLPRKEVFEAWEVARRVRRVMRGGPVVELAAGHGLLASILLLLDDSSVDATCVDVSQPKSHRRVLTALERHWPRLQGRVRYEERNLEDVCVGSDALVVSVHACGALTDRALDIGIRHRARIAVLPCCHDLKKCDSGSLAAWMDGPLAVDATRVGRLRAAGFHVATATIPKEITPKNRLIMAWP